MQRWLTTPWQRPRRPKTRPIGLKLRRTMRSSLVRGEYGKTVATKRWASEIDNFAALDLNALRSYIDPVAVERPSALYVAERPPTGRGQHLSARNGQRPLTKQTKGETGMANEVTTINPFGIRVQEASESRSTNTCSGRSRSGRYPKPRQQSCWPSSSPRDRRGYQ